MAAAMAAAGAPSGGVRGPVYPLGDDFRPQWQCQDENGRWIDYDATFNTTLENAYQNGQESIRHMPGRVVEFVYYLAGFLHENTETQRRRVMRRMLIQGRMSDNHQAALHRAQRGTPHLGAGPPPHRAGRDIEEWQSSTIAESSAVLRY